jgi:hypothetical protein
MRRIAERLGHGLGRDGAVEPALELAQIRAGVEQPDLLARRCQLASREHAED